MHGGDSMILTFHVPPLARGRDYVISIVYLLSIGQKIEKNGKSRTPGTAN